MNEFADIRNADTSNLLMAHVEHIAKYVRSSGDAEEARAFDYIEDRLKEWGCRYSRETHPAYISLPQQARLDVYADHFHMNVPCITHAMSASTGINGRTGAIVDVGEGAHNDFVRAGFRAGDVALINGLASPEITAVAIEYGAVAVIFVNGPELHEMIVSRVWGSPTSETVEWLINIPVVSILGEYGDEIKRRLVEFPQLSATVHTEVLTEWRQIPLLVAEIEGNEFPDEVVLFAGHVDSWHYGAMDNASANAVQLEALRVFGERREKLSRTLRVAFWSGHSHGRYAGSTWYADHHWEELENHAVLHVYVDSVGGKGATVLSEAWAMAETKQVAARIVEQETGETFNGGRFGRGGDQSFYGIGISSLFMCLSEQPPVDGPNLANVSRMLGGNGKTSGLGPWWHSVDDTIDKLDPEFLLRDARIYLAVLSNYLERSELALDFRPTVRELRSHLQNWQIQAGSRFSLASALSVCTELEHAVDEFYSTSRDTAAFNRTVVGLSRRLVPLNYTTGNRFDHDLASGYPPIPALQPIESLAHIPAQSAEEYQLVTLLRRRLNFVTQTLQESVRWVHAANS